MKLVSAIVRPFKLDAVRKALAAHGIQSFTVSEVRGFGGRGATYTENYLPKVKIEIVAGDNMVPLVLESVQLAAFTGQAGDGSIFVVDLIEALPLSA